MDDLIIIGPKKAGKTTYLMGLAARFEGTDNELQLGIRVEAISDDAKELKAKAKDQLQEGKKADSTKPLSTAAMPDYELRLDFPESLLETVRSREIFVKVRDYAGEIFDALAEKPSELRDYLHSFGKSKRWLLLLNDWEPILLDKKKRPTDDEYVLSLLHLLSILSEDLSDFRLAVVLGKCERGELWPGRREPELDIFSIRLPKTYHSLREKFRACPANLGFFACSTFGVLDPKIPLPNRRNVVGGSYKDAVILDKDRWKPYGLITPLVWLQTGRRWKWCHV